MSLTTALALAFVLLVNIAAVTTSRLRNLQWGLHAVAPLLAVAVFGVRNYLINDKAYELFIAGQLGAREELARQQAFWWSTFHLVVAGVFIVSILGFAIRWAADSREWWNGLGAVAGAVFLILWLLLRQVNFTRMV